MAFPPKPETFVSALRQMAELALTDRAFGGFLVALVAEPAPRLLREFPRVAEVVVLNEQRLEAHWHRNGRVGDRVLDVCPELMDAFLDDALASPLVRRIDPGFAEADGPRRVA
jgi:hypothetical protein